MDIIKASGEKEKFSEEKLYESLKRAGVKSEFARSVVKEVGKKVKPDITSEDILKHASRCITKRDPILAARYNLKHAIMALGPSGFLFEQYVAAILEEYGYDTEVGIMVRGGCVTHEVDVVARKENKHFMIECKYHNSRGIYSDLKVALYTHARFLDIKKVWEAQSGHKYFFHQPWLVTNTKCTSQAIQYAECAGLRIISWRYPKDAGLESLVEEKGLYPVTVLPSVNRYAKERLAENNIMLAKDLLDYSPNDLRKKMRINSNVAAGILYDVRRLCL